MIDTIVPSKDEPTVYQVVNELLKLNFINKIIVIDDGSKERINIEHEKVIVKRMEKSVGKNQAVGEGFKLTTTEFILLQDADLEYPVENVKKLYQFIPQHKMVVAKRFVPIDRMTISGVIANRLITWLLKEQDVFSGQRIVHRELL